MRGTGARRSGTAVLVALTIVSMLALAGCGAEKISSSEQTAQESCGGEECHDDVIAVRASGPHKDAGCLTCHDGADGEHATDPQTADADIAWEIESCAGCHEGEAVTYLYDDNAKPGPFGGSQRVPPQPKADTFPLYNQIVAGHAFAKDYNEEGAHAFMMKDHRETTRGKFETCVQCKSTKVAYAWKTGKELVVEKDTVVELTHTKTATTAAKSLKVPAGTTITYSTDEKTRAVDAKVTTPDGKTFTSMPDKSMDATANYNMTWASTIAATAETEEYGASCSHCHDPHSAKLAYVRDSMLDAIAGGGVDGSGGVNPYASSPNPDIAQAKQSDKRILACAQCHVEYTCGKSGVDGVDRDAFGWAKASDLHRLYTEMFEYKQDWKHKVIGQPLIKSQHSETELYWESVHYDAGVACSDCHMPEVRDADGRVFRSHWMTSPYKYENGALFTKFATATGLDVSYSDRPCASCHEDRMAAGIAQQKAVYERQKSVQQLLADAATALGSVKPAGAKYDEAVAAHRQAHVLWENLLVSENSMGFHNYEEVMNSMAEAEKFANSALAIAKALPKK